MFRTKSFPKYPILTLLVAFVWSDAFSQQSATIFEWEKNIQLFIKDRANNYGGTYYNRGLFRMHTPPMDMEYQLDIFTYRFSLFDDYEWSRSDNGFRSYVGSLSTTNFAVFSEVKNRVELSEKSVVTINAYQQEDLRVKRGLISLGYIYRFGSHHSAGISHFLGQQKNDLDASFFYRYNPPDRGSIKLKYTALDWANNIVSGLNETRGSNFEKLHRYTKHPSFFSFNARSPHVGRFRGELAAGYQPESSALVIRNGPDQNNSVRNDWVNYQSALLEASFNRATIGIVYQRTFARMEEFPADNSNFDLDYGNSQQQVRGGFYLQFEVGSFGAEQWFWIERNSDLQFDSNPEAYVEQDPVFTETGRSASLYPFHFREVRRFNKSRIFFSPASSPFTFILEHNGDWRTPENKSGNRAAAREYRNYYPNHILERNERLTFSTEIKFSDRALLLLGASIDLDGDKLHGFGWEREDAEYALFDGGFGRFTIRW